MLSFAVFVTLLAAASAATPFVPATHLDQISKAFPVMTTGAVYPGTYAAGAYPYGVHGAYPYNYNTYPYSTYPYNYNTAPIVQSVPAVSTIGVKPVASNVHFNTIPVQHSFPTKFGGQVGSPVYYTTAGAYPSQFQQFHGVNPWNYAVAH